MNTLFKKCKIAALFSMFLFFISNPSLAVDSTGSYYRIYGEAPLLWLDVTTSNNYYLDWIIRNNWNGPSGSFSIETWENDKVPFLIEYGASNNLLYLDSANLIGINTSIPSNELHILALSPAIRLDDSSMGGGYVDLDYNFNEFAIEGEAGLDIFEIDSRAPEHSFFMNQWGKIGIGTTFPSFPIDIRGNGNDYAAQVYVYNQNSATPGQARKLFQIANGNGPAKFSMWSGAEEWAFNARTDVFRISKQGTGAVEMELNQNGNLTIVGTLSSGSSRTIKHDIAPVDTQKVLNQVLSMPVAEWTYNHDKGVRHMGPMSEDFHTTFGLGDSDKKLTTIDTSGVALAAIQGLSKVGDERDGEIKALHAELQAKSLEIETLQSEMNNLKAMVQILIVKDKIVMAE